MLLSGFIRNAAADLEAVYPQHEARSIVSILVCERLGVQSWTHVVEPQTEIAPSALAGLEEDMRRLMSGEPLQYVLGSTEFYGRRFKVAPGVLIPRPETELLVDIAKSRMPRPDGRILDLCTGSGCIAWSLAWEFPSAQVTGVDISEDALAIARAQFADESSDASECSSPAGPSLVAECSSPEVPSVRFVHSDILDYSHVPAEGRFDFITSNPPYICDSEKPLMRSNVLDFEPHLALFVSDSDPLLFYRAVAHWADVLLTEDGCGIVEINEHLSEQTARCFSDAGFKTVEILKDFFGKTRFVFFGR